MISQYLNNEYNSKPIQLVIVEYLGPYHAESFGLQRIPDKSSGTSHLGKYNLFGLQFSLL